MGVVSSRASAATAPPLNRNVSAIDGLRAGSVIAILLYHGQVGAEGGFLAVSQFFTLSGYLVMSILLRSADSADGLHLQSFWGRRYRRLMPAALLTLAGVVVFGFTLATEQQASGLQRSVPAALAQVVNWHFIFTDVSYAELFQAPSPIQHFWSLAIEEQFYILAPILLLALLKVTRSPKALATVFAAGVIGSTLTMLLMFERGSSVDRLYFGTDTRAAEMLSGCLLAVGLHYFRPRLEERGRRVLGGIGLAAYGASVWAAFTISVTDARLYRGGFLLLSLMTCLVVWSLVEDTGPLRRVLSLGPLTALGRITYAVYLFHWPLMLILTEARTGLDGWVLFALQVAVTIPLAAVSGKYLENPIRRGRSAPGDRRLPFALVGVGMLIAGAGIALQFHDVETDLAGLGEEAGEAPPNAAARDEAQTMLLIGDESGLAFSARIADPTVVETLPFLCGDSPENDTCATWTDWSTAIEEHDPDVVLFQVNDWSEADLASRAGTDDLDALTEWTRSALSDGFDVLSSQGATVVWAQSPGDFGAALRADRNPFLLAMRDLSSSRRDLRRLGIVDDVAATQADLRLYARRAEGNAPRVLIVGDSVSRTIGYGLERWALATGEAVVWSAGTEGCGIARGGYVSDTTGRETPMATACEVVPDGWSEQIATFAPDVVVIASNAADFRERRLDGWAEPLQPGDERFDDFLVSEYVHAYDTLSSGGAEVIWMTSPCASDIFGQFVEADGENAVDSDRIRHVNEVILPRVVDARPALRTFDLYGRLCPDGEFIDDPDGVGALRVDGIHFSPAGSLWLAETYGPELLATAPS